MFCEVISISQLLHRAHWELKLEFSSHVRDVRYPVMTSRMTGVHSNDGCLCLSLSCDAFPW